jgi:hypothetical protein
MVDLDVAGLRPLEHRVEIAGGLLCELAAGEGVGVLRQHEGGRIEGVLHSGAHRIGAAVIDGCADRADERDDAECEQRRHAAGPVLEKSLERHRVPPAAELSGGDFPEHATDRFEIL